MHRWEEFSLNNISGFYCLTCDQYYLIDKESCLYIFTHHLNNLLYYRPLNGNKEIVTFDIKRLRERYNIKDEDINNVCHNYLMTGTKRELERLTDILIATIT